MTYVDGIMAAVPNANREAYIEHAKFFATIFREFGALSIVECWGENVPDGVLTSMPMAVQKKDDETVVFSWVVWPSKEVRDAGHARMETDPRMLESEMPFDGKRMIYGGFDMVLDA